MIKISYEKFINDKLTNNDLKIKAIFTSILSPLWYFISTLYDRNHTDPIHQKYAENVSKIFDPGIPHQERKTWDRKEICFWQALVPIDKHFMIFWLLKN